MFNGVRGEGIKKFFKNRSGRKLSFASKEPVKVQAGAQISEIAALAVTNNTDGFFFSTLKTEKSDLKAKLAVEPNPKLQEKLEWTEDYLRQFEEVVGKIKKTTTVKKDHELRTLLSSIQLQGKKTQDSLLKLAFVIAKNDLGLLINEIEVINEHTRVYEQSVKSYKTKTGKDDYHKISIDEAHLRTIYKSLAKTIDSIKDSLKDNPSDHDLKQKLVVIEKLADDLIKFTSSPEIYNRIRTEVDSELAKAKAPVAPAQQPKPKKPVTNPTPGPAVTPPPKPSYQDDVTAYETELKKINDYIVELNRLIAKAEELTADVVITPELIDEIVMIDEKIKEYSKKIEESKLSLSRRARDVREKHKIDITKLTTIQAVKVETIQYKIPYALYIESLERKSLEATEDIKELALSKAKAEKEEIPKINAKIAQLYKLLIAINSLIDKRIIHFSKTNHKNITSLYKERHAKRKKLAEDYALGNVDYISAVPQEEDIFKAKLTEIRSLWLEAFNKAPISPSGKIIFDSTEYVTAITQLIAGVQETAKIEIIAESNKRFNETIAQIAKEKHAALNKLEKLVRARLDAIFRSDTISEIVEPGIDYNEWLTVVEYEELRMLATEPEYKNLVPNAMEIIDNCIKEQEVKYQDIKKRVKADTVRELKNELMALPEQIGALPIDEHFEKNIFALFVAFKVRYGTLKDFDYDIDIKNNKYYVSYQTVKYNYSTGAYHLEKEEIKRALMSPEKLQEYRASRNIKPEPVVPQEQKPETEEELHKPRIVVEGEDPSKVKVTNRTIQLATTRRQVIDRAKGLVIKNADSLTVSLIKQGLRIRYNEHLRDQLKSLNAKLSLVNKSNYRSRKDIKFQGDETEQDLAFKTPKDKFNIEDYKLEFRLIDEEKKRSDLLYTFDLDNISDELHGRTK